MLLEVFSMGSELSGFLRRRDVSGRRGLGAKWPGGMYELTLKALSSTENFLLWLQLPCGSLICRRGHPESWTSLPEGLTRGPLARSIQLPQCGGRPPSLPVFFPKPFSPLGHAGRNLPEIPDTALTE